MRSITRDQYAGRPLPDRFPDISRSLHHEPRQRDIHQYADRQRMPLKIMLTA